MHCNNLSLVLLINDLRDYSAIILANQEEAMASTSDCSCLRATPMSPDEFLVAMGRSNVQHRGLDGRVHFKNRFDG